MKTDFGRLVSGAVYEYTHLCHFEPITNHPVVFTWGSISAVVKRTGGRGRREATGAARTQGFMKE